jgi:hypothetical protein
MVKMINVNFGSEMYVHEDRVDEYLAAGHKLAAKPSSEPAEKPKRAKKTTEKK